MNGGGLHWSPLFGENCPWSSDPGLEPTSKKGKTVLRGEFLQLGQHRGGRYGPDCQLALRNGVKRAKMSNVTCQIEAKRDVQHALFSLFYSYNIILLYLYYIYLTISLGKERGLHKNNRFEMTFDIWQLTFFSQEFWDNRQVSSSLKIDSNCLLGFSRPLSMAL